MFDQICHFIVKSVENEKNRSPKEKFSHKNIIINTRDNLNPYSDSEFTLQDIIPDSNEYLRNIKAIMLNGKNSEYSYGPNEVSFNLFKYFTDLNWRRVGEIVNIIFKEGYFS